MGNSPLSASSLRHYPVETSGYPWVNVTVEGELRGLLVDLLDSHKNDFILDGSVSGVSCGVCTPSHKDLLRGEGGKEVKRGRKARRRKEGGREIE